MLEKINVSLYGSGDRGCPLRAEIISCDHCDSCSFYKNNTCLKVTSAFASTKCIYGQLSKVKGYTKYASKYSDFKWKYKEDAMYDKLERPASHNVLGVIGDYVYINLHTVEIRERRPDDRGWDFRFFKLPSGLEVALHVPFGGCDPSFILKTDLEDLSKDGLLYRLFVETPLTIFDRTPIRSYQAETLPYLAECLRKHLPELATKFFKLYPDFDYKINYVGRKAYINTLPIGTVIKDCHSNKFTLVDLDTLVCEEYSSAFIPFDIRKGYLKLKLTGKETIEIESNDQVGENTKFIE